MIEALIVTASIIVYTAVAGFAYVLAHKVDDGGGDRQVVAAIWPLSLAFIIVRWLVLIGPRVVVRWQGRKLPKAVALSKRDEYIRALAKFGENE